MTSRAGAVIPGGLRVPWHRVQKVDWPLLAAVLASVVLGAAMIYSATLRGGAVERAWEDLVVKQVVFAAIGFGVLAMVALTEYRVLLTLWPWLYGGTLLLLLGLPWLGTERLGATRWYALGPFELQPSELAKLALIVSLAAFFETHDVGRMRNLLASLALVAVPMALVLRQPDLSTAVLMTAIWAGVAFTAGMRPLHLALLSVLVGPFVALVLRLDVLQPYQMLRIVALIDPQVDPKVAGYQNIQTLLAVGNGGLTGTGFASGLQAQGGWLPLVFTDNIYALIAEELGFVGGIAVLALLGFVVLRVLRVGSLAQDTGGALIAAGVASYLLAQTFVNVGVVLQLVPVTGLSLPFLSYGGSSLLTLMAAVGLVQSVLVRRKPIEFRG